MKKTWVIILIIIGSVITLIFTFLIGMGLFVGNQINKISEDNKTSYNEDQRIRELPDLYGVIVTDNMIVNPVSQRNTALYAFGVGAKQKTSGARISGSTGFSNYSFPDCPIDYPNNTKLLIDDKLYPIDFKNVILTKVGKSIEEKKGISVEVFKIANTTYGYISVEDALNRKAYDSLRVLMKSRIKKLKGRHKIIDTYLADDKKYKVNILILREYNFNAGDTLIFKGKIEGNKIVPLF